jgi:hypothetical protein
MFGFRQRMVYPGSIPGSAIASNCEIDSFVVPAQGAVKQSQLHTKGFIP